MERKIITRKEAIALGLKKYFTGKACVNGHVSERNTQGGCTECKVRARRDWRKANPEKEKEYQRKYCKENPEKVREGIRKWRKANPEKSLAHTKKYQLANPAKVKESMKLWASKNRDKVNSYRRKYNAETKASKIFFQMTAAAAQVSTIKPKTKSTK